MVFKKKHMVLTIFFLMIIFIMSFQDYKVVATSTNDSTNEIYSNLIIDTKSINIQNNIYSVLLNNDYIYIIDNNGIVIKRLDYLPDDKFISKYLQTTTDFDSKNISLEVIDDIDNKGTKDLLVIIKNYSFISVKAISYEDNKIIWSYYPTMKSDKICGINNYCDENVEISNYKIDKNLFVVTGYKLEEINLKNGKVIKNFNYSNNIWDLAIISDINNDGVKDIALAVQPTKVLTIDGKTFKKINEITVAKDMTLYKRDYIIKLNVWSLEYLPSRDILVAGSEDGFVYEISPKENTIVNSYLITHPNKFLYSNFIDSNLKKIEYYYENNTKNIYFGDFFKESSYMKIYKTQSFDTDNLEDYIVVYHPGASKYKTFAKCSSVDSCIIEEKNEVNKFISTNGKVITYLGLRETAIVEDLSTNKILIKSSIFTDGKDEFESISDVKIYILDNGYLVNIDNGNLIKFNNNGTFEEPDWTLNIIRAQSHETTDDRLIIYDSISDYKSGFKIYDKDLKEILVYKSDNKRITRNIVDNDYLYIYEQDNESNYFYKVFDLKNAQLVASSQLNDNLNALINFTKIENKDDEMYKDINNDGIKELIVKLLYQEANTAIIKNINLVYDLVNDTVLYNFSFEMFSDVSNKIVYDDINNDNFPDFLTYYTNNENKTIFKIFDVKNNNYIKNYTFDINLNYHKIKFLSDLNNDGSTDIILDHDIDVYKLNNDIPNHGYIIDFQNNYYKEYTNEYNENYLYNIVSIEDLDNDGVKEIITFDSPNINSGMDRFPLKIKISNYTNGEIITKFTKEVFVGNLTTKKTYPSNLFKLKETNNDGVRDIVLYSVDYENNVMFEVMDYKTNEVIKTYSTNIEYKNENVYLDEKNYFYKTFELLTFGDKTYYVVVPSGKFTYMSIFFDTDNFKIWNYTGTNFKGFYLDKMIFKDLYNNKINVTSPVKADDIKISISGVFKNIYSFKINSKEKIDKINIYYDRIPYANFKGNNFTVNLPKSEYNLVFFIETEDGGTYYYNNIFTIDDSLSQTVLYLTLETAVFTILFIGSSILIKKLYLRR